MSLGNKRDRYIRTQVTRMHLSLIHICFCDTMSVMNIAKLYNYHKKRQEIGRENQFIRHEDVYKRQVDGVHIVIDGNVAYSLAGEIEMCIRDRCRIVL